MAHHNTVFAQWLKFVPISHHTGPRGGIRARFCLTFSIAVEGPLVLGRDSHMGGGLFAATDGPADDNQ